MAADFNKILGYLLLSYKLLIIEGNEDNEGWFPSNVINHYVVFHWMYDHVIFWFCFFNFFSFFICQFFPFLYYFLIFFIFCGFWFLNFSWFLHFFLWFYFDFFLEVFDWFSTFQLIFWSFFDFWFSLIFWFFVWSDFWIFPDLFIHLFVYFEIVWLLWLCDIFLDFSIFLRFSGFFSEFLIFFGRLFFSIFLDLFDF